MPYISTKTFAHELGLSCAFRQWRAKSHCQYIHGYALKVKFVFSANKLDARNWVVDFGSFSEVRDYLRLMLDHTLLVAADDPQRDTLELLAAAGLAQVRVVANTGCEAFAKLLYDYVAEWLKTQRGDEVTLVSCEVSEHGANSAIYSVEVPWHYKQGEQH